MQLVARSTKGTLIEKLIDTLYQIRGAYSLVILTNKKLIGGRDPFGIRPLVLGQKDGAYVLASETCALDMIGAEFECLGLEGRTFYSNRQQILDYLAHNLHQF